MEYRKPKLRFNGFDEEWEKKRLDEIIQLNSGMDYKHLEDGDIPVYGTGGYMLNVNKALSYNEDAIGIGRKGTIDKPFILKAPFWTVDTLFYAIPQNDNDLQFCNCLFQKVDWRKHDESTGVPSLSKNIINAVEVNTVLNITEQKKIGEFFEELDELICAKEQEVEKLKQIKAALLDKMFPNDESDKPNRGGYNEMIYNVLQNASLVYGGDKPNVPCIRFRGFSEPWGRKTIGELFLLRNGYTPSKSNPNFWNNGDIPWFRMEDIRENGHILKSSIQYVTKEAVKDSGLFPAGSIILSTTATIGEHALLIADSLANQRFTVLQTVNRWKTIDMMYFYQYGFILGAWCKKNVNVGGLNAVNISDLKNHTVPYPSMQEQTMIAEYLLSHDNRLLDAQHQIIKLRNIKQACLQKMFA
ncbi:MAG: restriction endonuclease subunit S [Clostridium sp.]|nr:restriction endonuclease subunit S [Clostridium sp.]